MICEVTISELQENGRYESRRFEIESFEQLVEFFDEVYADFLNQLGADPYGPPPVDELSGDVVGGVGVLCKNCRGHEIEVGVGDQWWLLIDRKGQQAEPAVNDQPPDHDFIFYLHGWHYTGVAASSVVWREKSLAWIEEWLGAE